MLYPTLWLSFLIKESYVEYFSYIRLQADLISYVFLQVNLQGESENTKFLIRKN